jgi:hypothetical protein
VPQEELFIPTSIFSDRTLKVLEPIVEYLKESKNLSFHEIGTILNRDERTIWTVYSRVRKKRAPHLHPALPAKGVADPVFVPVHIICDRTLKVLESIVEYLKIEKAFTYHQIALLLNRDDRTIWTVFMRAKKKREAQNRNSAMETKGVGA